MDLVCEDRMLGGVRDFGAGGMRGFDGSEKRYWGYGECELIVGGMVGW